MGDKNLPQLVNPMNEIMLNGMPNLPQIIAESMPKFIPPASFDQNPVAIWFANKKVGQLAKRAEMEANIAKHARNAVLDKLEVIHAVVTFSARVADTLGDYEDKKTMRGLAIQEKQADIYIKTAQAQQIGWEAKLSELDYNLKLKQYQKMMEE